MTMQAQLVKRSWLLRRFEVSDGAKTHVVEYFGRGIGWERVRVDGVDVSGGRSVWWFIPEFSFQVGDLPARITVRVGPWLTIRSFRLEVEGIALYTEGG